MKEDIIKNGEETGKELFKNTNVNITLEGWPCAVALIGFGLVYVMATKIKCDIQTKQLSNVDTKRIEKVA